jgi:uncharacterized protein (DUF2252 family)
MCAHMPRLLFTMLVGGVIAVWATHPLLVSGQSRGDTDEDRLLLGTWKFNAAKSKYKIGIPPQSQIRVYEPSGERVKATIKTTHANGRSTTVEYVANYDSVEYPVTGSSDADTIALKKVAPRTAEAILSHAGQVMATVRRVISEDGKTMTIAYQGTLLGERADYVAVYDKQN